MKLARIGAATACVGLAVGLFVSSALAEADSCAVHTKEVVIGKKAAVADMWANWRESDGSIQAETKKMLREAEKGLKSATPPEGLCPTGCKAAPQPQIRFSSVPSKFISGYSDEAHCNQLAKETETKPMSFPGRKFASLDDLTKWFGEFSQGKGDDGSALYQKCDGDCSPQYHCHIQPRDHGFVLDANVRCGAARDKDDNKYQLTVAYRWSCIGA